MKKKKRKCHKNYNEFYKSCNPIVNSKPKFVASTLEDRIEYLREAIRSATPNHGAPCGCVLCEALIFDYEAKLGNINIKTGERK